MIDYIIEKFIVMSQGIITVDDGELVFVGNFSVFINLNLTNTFAETLTFLCHCVDSC